MGERRRLKRGTKRVGASHSVTPKEFLHAGSNRRSAVQPRIHFRGTRRPRVRARMPSCPCCVPWADGDEEEDFEASGDEMAMDNVTAADWDDARGRGRGRERGRAPAARIRRRRQRAREPTLAEELAPLSAELCGGMNENHAEHVLAYARTYVPAPNAVSARMLAVLPNGFELEVTGQDGDVSSQLARYPKPMHSARQVRALAASIRAGELTAHTPASLRTSGGKRSGGARAWEGMCVGVGVAALAAIIIIRSRRSHS